MPFYLARRSFLGDTAYPTSDFIRGFLSYWQSQFETVSDCIHSRFVSWLKSLVLKKSWRTFRQPEPEKQSAEVTSSIADWMAALRGNFATRTEHLGNGIRVMKTFLIYWKEAVRSTVLCKGWALWIWANERWHKNGPTLKSVSQ